PVVLVSGRCRRESHLGKGRRASDVLGAADVPDELIARVHERTGGKAFFLEEIAHSLIEPGTVRIDAGQARVVGTLDALHIPATVQAVIRGTARSAPSPGSRGPPP